MGFVLVSGNGNATKRAYLRVVDVGGVVGQGGAGVHAVEEGVEVGVDVEEVAVLALDETLVGGVVEEPDQLGEEAIDVEQAHRLLVEAELGPGGDLEHLLEG